MFFEGYDLYVGASVLGAAMQIAVGAIWGIETNRRRRKSCKRPEQMA